jgi:Ca2+-binding EF-hand superfamily protein
MCAFEEKLENSMTMSVLRMMDKSGDRLLTIDELYEGSKILGHNLSRDECDKILNRCDAGEFVGNRIS